MWHPLYDGGEKQGVCKEVERFTILRKVIRSINRNESSNAY